MAELKQFSRDEVSKTDQKLTRFIIHNKVYDVTKFLNEHPGGEEVLLDHKGLDASEDFDDVGHSTDAHELMKTYLIGEIIENERTNTKPKQGWYAGGAKTQQENSNSTSNFTFMVAGGVLFLLIAFWYFQNV